MSGSYGSNDIGFINMRVRKAAEELQAAVDLYCYGHYPQCC